MQESVVSPEDVASPEKLRAIDDFAEYLESLRPEERSLLSTYMKASPAEKKVMPQEQHLKGYLLYGRFMYHLMKIKGNLGKPTDQERIETYQKEGLSVTVPEGRSWHSDEMMCAEHDGVPYCVEATFHEEDQDRDTYLKDVRRGIHHRQLMIERHHFLLKSIYAHLTSLSIGPIWLMAGGGGQLQAFFGNKTGYLCIVYLDMVDLADEVNPEYMKVIGNETFTLQVQWERNNHYFKKFKLHGIKVERSSE